MRRGLLICFTGIDGTGKTTLARWTGEFLAKRGIPTRYVWGSYEERLAHPFISLGQKIFVRKQQKRNYQEYHRSVNKALGNSFISTLYQGLALSEYFSQLLFKVILPVTCQRHTIADRYVYDTLLNMAVNMNQSPEKLRQRIHRFLKLCPAPVIVFHLDATPEVVMKRKSDIPALEYEAKRRQLYLILAKDFHFVSLDAQAPLEEIKSRIGRQLEKMLKGVA